jgi:hypothetical protein
MRAAIVLAGFFLVSSSALTAEPQMKNAARKPVVVAVAVTTVPTHKAATQKVVRAAAIETPVAEGSLEKFGSCCLPQ